MAFKEWFQNAVCQDHAPRAWQAMLAEKSQFESCLIRIPTGFGKTLGVLSAWAWNRLQRKDKSWPRRLVWCLPMRVLVEQTEAEVRRVLESMGLLWDGVGDHECKVGVHLLMGGTDAGEWHLHPEHCSILIGTQDMLLSRTLNRGYGAARGRWPMDFGLLNQDCLWVMDEVQLMDVGLATSAQLQAFRHEDAAKSLRPCHTWWMSATMQESWLQSVDTKDFFETLGARVEIPASERNGDLWSVSKRCEVQEVSEEKGVAALALERHQLGTLTLVVVNTVDAARKVYAALAEKARAQNVDVRLVHSRFRPHERKRWRQEFLQRQAPITEGGRIVVATQVIEAGVDISAATLLTELAPWPSLVQRFGRCARFAGETGSVILLDRGWSEKDAKKVLPYELNEILQVREIVRDLKDVSPASLEANEAELSNAQLLERYPYKPQHLLLRQEWEELFDTTPDLSGADLDISRFIRSGEENDCQVFWRDIPVNGPSENWKPLRDELCSVRFLDAREWLCGKDGQTVKTKTVQGRNRVVAWTWDWVEGCWNRRTAKSQILPGTVILVDASFGGYDPVLGWDRDAKASNDFSLDIHADSEITLQERADSMAQGEDLSQANWKTIATHGEEVAAEAEQIARTVGLSSELMEILEIGGRWHDVGKSHPVFQGSMRHTDRPNRQDLAKAPKEAWSRTHLYRDGDDHRPGFRHELASMLALFDSLLACDAGNEALDPRPGLTWEGGCLIAWEPGRVGTHLERSIHRLSAPSFNLLAYLVLSHHGKVRTSLQASPLDQDYVDKDGRGLPLRGVREGDQIPECWGEQKEFYGKGIDLTLEPAYLGLSEVTGASWTERVQGLLEQFGPGALAYLEALLRAADIRASRLTTADPRLAEVGE